MNGTLYYKNVAVKLDTEVDSPRSTLAKAIGLKLALLLAAPLLIYGAFLLFLAGCGSSDITRADATDGGNGQAAQHLLIDDFEPENPGGPCTKKKGWSSWDKLDLKPSPYGDDPPGTVKNPKGNNCYLKVVPNTDPKAKYPGGAMIYIGKYVDPDSYLTFDLRIEPSEDGSAQYNKITFEIVDDDNTPYKINIAPSDFNKGGDDLLSFTHINETANAGDWVRVSIPLNKFLDINSTLGDNILNTGASQSTKNTDTPDAGINDAEATDTTSSKTTTQNGGLLALRIKPTSLKLVLNFDNFSITSENEAEVLATITPSESPDAGTDADVIESSDGGIEQDGAVANPDAGFDAGTQTDTGQDGGAPADGGIDGSPIIDGGTDSGPAVNPNNPPYMIDNMEAAYNWFSFGGATASYTGSANAPAPTGAQVLGSYVLDVHGTVNNGAAYPGGIGIYVGKNLSGTDYITFSVAGNGAIGSILLADTDTGTGMDYYKYSGPVISSDTGQFALHGWRTFSLPVSAFQLDTQQNTYTGEPLGDAVFNPTLGINNDGFKQVTFTLQTNSNAPTNSQIHLYMNDVKITTSNEGDGIPDVALPNPVSPFQVDNFDDGNYSSSPEWFSGDGIIIDVVEYALAGIAPPAGSGTHFVTLHGSIIPAAIYGGYFGTYVGKKVKPLNDIFKLSAWDLVGRLKITLEFEMEDGSTRKFKYTYEDADLPEDPIDKSIPLTAFTDDTNKNPSSLPAVDDDGNRKLKNITFTLEKTTGDVDDTMVSLDKIRIEP